VEVARVKAWPAAALVTAAAELAKGFLSVIEAVGEGSRFEPSARAALQRLITPE
jgi:hypothetical protein